MTSVLCTLPLEEISGIQRMSARGGGGSCGRGFGGRNEGLCGSKWVRVRPAMRICSQWKEIPEEQTWRGSSCKGGLQVVGGVGLLDGLFM